MYIIICEMNHQSRFDAWDRVLGAGQGARGWCTGMTQRDGREGGGRGVQDGEHMYTRGGFMSNFFLLLKKKKSQSLPISFLSCSEKYNGKTHVNFKESQYRK